MARRVRQLSPRRPLRFGAIDPRHHAAGGAEVFPDMLSVSLRKDAIDDDLLSHELGHLIAELEHDYLAISDRIPRLTPDRRMIGTMLSMFEHPAVYALQRDHGFDPAAAADVKMQEYVEDFDRLPPEPASGNVYYEKIQGYIELQYLRPDDPRWARIDTNFAKRAPRSYADAQDLLRVVSPDRIARHAYREMLDGLVDAVGARGAYWPPLVELRPAARTDLA
jgi:hypothetical protein